MKTFTLEQIAKVTGGMLTKTADVAITNIAIVILPNIVNDKFWITTYNIRAIPVGGFVQLAGEEVDNDEIPF